MLEVKVVPWWFCVLVLSKACHLHCCSPLKQHSAFNPLRGSCALPTNMFNSFPDTRGTLVTTTEKDKKRERQGREGWEEKLEGTKCLFCICYWQMCNEWTNEWPNTRPRRLETFEGEISHGKLWGQINPIFLCFDWLRERMGGSEDAAGHLGVLPLNQRLIKRTFRGMD